ncbi:MAG: hypothetical protein ACTSUE_19870 [Promethearchaeota archaeon]
MSGQSTYKKTLYEIPGENVMLGFFTAGNFTCEPCLRIRPFVAEAFSHLPVIETKIIPSEEGPGKVPHFVLYDEFEGELDKYQMSDKELVIKWLMEKTPVKLNL